MTLYHGEPLLADQTFYGGNKACTLVACMLAEQILLGNFDKNTIDKTIELASKMFVHSGLNRFLYVAEAIEKFALRNIEIAEEMTACPEAVVQEGETVIPSIRQVLCEWVDEDSVAVIVRGGYTFCVFYTDKFYLLDSHRDTVLRQADFLHNKKPRETAMGALLSFEFALDLIAFVESFQPDCTVDKNYCLDAQMDIAKIRLK